MSQGEQLNGSCSLFSVLLGIFTVLQGSYGVDISDENCSLIYHKDWYVVLLISMVAAII